MKVTQGKSAFAFARFSGLKRYATTSVSYGTPVCARIPSRQGTRLSMRFMHTMTMLTSGVSISTKIENLNQTFGEVEVEGAGGRVGREDEVFVQRNEGFPDV